MAKRGRTRREALAKAMQGKHFKVLKNINAAIRKGDILEKSGTYYIKKGEPRGEHSVRVPVLWGLFKLKVKAPNFLIAGAVEAAPAYFEEL
jgi:hypothetical protein